MHLYLCHPWDEKMKHVVVFHLGNYLGFGGCFSVEQQPW
jgi:hypothetical protein